MSFSIQPDIEKIRQEFYNCPGRYYTLSIQDLIERFIDLYWLQDILTAQENLCKGLTNAISANYTLSIDEAKSMIDSPNVNEYSNIFNGIKAHWITTDMSISGLGYRPQGIIYKDNVTGLIRIAIHPGANRWIAMLMNHNIPTELIVYDSDNVLEPYFTSLTFEEFIGDAVNGPIRKHRDLYMDVEPTGNIVLHEQGETHDNLIHFHNMQIQKMLAGKKISIYIGQKDFQRATHLLELIKNHMVRPHPELFGNVQLIDADDKFSVPERENFSGVSIYLSDNINLNISCAYLLFLLDVTNSVCYYKKDVLVFNNNHRDCKKLMKQYTVSYKDSFLNNYQWTNSCKKIPRHVVDIPERKNQGGIFYAI